jgi:hypothetical protein
MATNSTSRRWSVTRVRNTATVAAALSGAVLWAATASAQLDPLLFLRRVPPTVIIAFDTSFRMLEDGAGYYYDPHTYRTTDDPVVATALGVNGAVDLNYRRKILNLTYENVQDSSTKFEAENIVAVDSSNAAYATFYDATRFEMAKKGIDMALGEYANAGFRFGLVKHRQNSPQWRMQNDNCDKPVRVTNSAALQLVSDANPCGAGGSGRFGLYDPMVSGANFSIETSLGGGAQVVAPAAGTAAAIRTVMQRGVLDAQGLIPAGSGTRNYGDRPLSHLLDDAKILVQNAMTADSASNRSCRNTVVVLVTAGKDDGDNSYTNSHNSATTATSFVNVSASGVTKRVPIHVVAIRPRADHEASLQQIASNSGGIYRNVASAQDVAAAVHYAVQAGFGRATQFDAGSASEFVPVSPVVATVNLKDGRSATGAALSNTTITANPGGQTLPQRSNVIITSGFALPGFEGVIRAFRTYRPVADPTKPTGWKFVSDGTRLWPDLDGRPTLAGKARVPADANTRNIYTWVPDGAGGGNIVPFKADAASVALLAPHMNAGTQTATVISFVRSQPLGAIIGSTPAVMDVPSLDPPPDDAYGRPDVAASFAGTYKNRRAMLFVGANDGMIHAIDARTGYEVWAFIPYNLLPKLQTLRDGQSVEQFDYFVDSSPKIAEVKIGGQWRSLLYIGEGPGGTFYQAFDVTSAGMGVAPEADDINAVTSLLGTFDQPNESIQFKWAFPNYDHFDPAYSGSFAVSDATPGGKVKVYGDLKTTANYAEKTVGYTWSDPAVAPLVADRSVNALIVGSGYFPDIEAQLPNRGNSAPQAGNALYVLNADTGLPLGNAAGNSCPTISSGSGSGNGCITVGDVNSNKRKNALQADPTAAGQAASLVIDRAYLGDVDGRYWRFNITSGGAISASQMVDTSQPIYASSALLFVGSADVYMFFATGSDLLPSSAVGGTGAFKLYGLKDNTPAAGATTKFTLTLASVSNSSGLATGERPSTAPSVAGDIVFYTTTSEDATTPCGDFTSNLYAVTYVGGAAYDSNNTGKIENGESPVVRTMVGRATAPFIVDQHLYVATGGATGANIEAFGDPEDFNNGIGQVGVRILSWREIR